MDKDAACHLWLTRDFSQFFLIPDRAIVPPGLDPIYDLEEKQKLVSLESLAAYACSEEEAQEHLRAAWQASLDSAKQAWLNLYHFSQQTGREIDFDEVSTQFQEGLRMAGPRAQESFEIGRAFVESVVAAVNSSEDLPESEQKALFKQVFGQLPQMLEQFSEAGLEQAAQDPDAWADDLYQQVFGEMDAKKQERRRQALADDIRASIADGLRSVGMKPSMDFESGEPENSKP